MSSLTSRVRDRCGTGETGSSLVEVVVAGVVGSLLLGAFYTMMWGFQDDVAVAGDLAAAQDEARPVMRDLVVDLRQATPPRAASGGRPVVSLSESHITFASDRYDADGPELLTYRLESCSAGLCDLRRTVLAADGDAEAPNWTYDDATVLTDTVIAEGVVDPAAGGSPLFEGVSYLSGTASVTSSCDATTATKCTFPIVGVHLQIDPNGERDNPRVYELFEEVRMRNAG